MGPSREGARGRERGGARGRAREGSASKGEGERKLETRRGERDTYCMYQHHLVNMGTACPVMVLKGFLHNGKLTVPPLSLSRHPQLCRLEKSSFCF